MSAPCLVTSTPAPPTPSRSAPPPVRLVRVAAPAATAAPSLRSAASESALWHRLECPCHAGFRYASSITFTKHFQSQRHQLYELQKRCREQRIRLGQMESLTTQLQQQLRRSESTTSTLTTQYDTLNQRLSAAICKTKTLEDTLFEMMHQKHRHYAATVIVHAWRAYIARRRHARLQGQYARRVFDQCLKHMQSVYQYRKALLICYSMMES